MALRMRIYAFLSILAAAGLFLTAMFALSQPGTHFIGPAFIAVLTGGIALTWGISLFQRAGNSPASATVYRHAASET